VTTFYQYRQWNNQSGVVGFGLGAKVCANAWIAMKLKNKMKQQKMLVNLGRNVFELTLSGFSLCWWQNARGIMDRIDQGPRYPL